MKICIIILLIIQLIFLFLAISGIFQVAKNQLRISCILLHISDILECDNEEG